MDYKDFVDAQSYPPVKLKTFNLSWPYGPSLATAFTVLRQGQSKFSDFPKTVFSLNHVSVTCVFCLAGIAMYHEQIKPFFAICLCWSWFIWQKSSILRYQTVLKMKPSKNSSTQASYSSCDRTGCMLLLLMGSVSTGIDAVDVLAWYNPHWYRSMTLLLTVWLHYCSTQLLILRAHPQLFSFLEIPSLLFAASVFLLGLSRPFSMLKVQIMSKLTLYVIKIYAGLVCDCGCICAKQYGGLLVR